MSYGFFDTIGGEIAFIGTLIVGYGLGKMLEVFIKMCKEKNKLLNDTDRIIGKLRKW